MSSVFADAGSGIVVALLTPMTATMPSHVGGGGVVVNVVTEYPFGDNVTVTVATSSDSAAAAAIPLAIRIPVWATHATATATADALHGERTTLAVVAGEYLRLSCAGGGATTTVHLALNPAIRVERGWGAHGANGAVVTRGALVYALALKETQELLHPPWACFPSGCSKDVAIKSNSSWNYGYILGDTPASLAAHMTFEQVQAGHSLPPFAGGSKAPVRIRAKVRRMDAWTVDPLFPLSAANPPTSPISCAAADGGTGGGMNGCGAVEYVIL